MNTSRAFAYLRTRLAAAWVLALALTPAAHAQQRYWYDGDTRRALWSQPDMLADFGAARAEKNQVIKPSALVKDLSMSTSPVFRDAASDASPSRALPGGVLLRFAPGTTDAQRQALLARYGLTDARALGDATGAWLVPTAPGTASLDLANRLFESGDFATAAPNWWRPRALK